MTDQKHTALPWKIVLTDDEHPDPAGGYEQVTYVEIEDAHGNTLFEFDADDSPLASGTSAGGISKLDMFRKIVTAVNNHKELLDVCRKLLGAAAIARIGDVPITWDGLIGEAQAAIEKAERGQG